MLVLAVALFPKEERPGERRRLTEVEAEQLGLDRVEQVARGPRGGAVRGGLLHGLSP
jgi:hypothetical protein